jgi:hypothetical protein
MELALQAGIANWRIQSGESQEGQTHVTVTPCGVGMAPSVPPNSPPGYTSVFQELSTGQTLSPV